MSALVHRICALPPLAPARVPVGTNLGLWHLPLALLSGRLLSAKRTEGAHLKTGVEAHRRRKPEREPPQAAQTAGFTGN